MDSSTCDYNQKQGGNQQQDQESAKGGHVLGSREDAIDFPVSWDWHRHYSLYFYGHDPGPNEPPEHTVEELHERLLPLEERIAGLSEEEIRRLGLKHIWDEVRELKQALRFTYKRIGEAIRAKRKPQKVKKQIKTTEV